MGTYNYGHMQNHFTATFFEDRPGEVQYKYYDVVQSGLYRAYARVTLGTSSSFFPLPFPRPFLLASHGLP